MKLLADRLKELESKTPALEARYIFGQDIRKLLMTHISSPLFKKAESLEGFRKYFALLAAGTVQSAAIGIYFHYTDPYENHDIRLHAERMALKEYLTQEGLVAPRHQS